MYKEILKNTFSSVFDKKEFLFKALLIPTLFLMIFDYFMALDFNNLYVTIPLFILMMLINITISISTHRILLLEKSNIPTWGLFKLSSREYKFLASSGKLGLILFVPLLIGGVIFAGMGIMFKSEENMNLLIFVSLFVFFMYILYLATRFSMVFPSIAVDKAITLRQSWSYTKNYKLLCFITIIIFPLLFGALFTVVYGAAIRFLMAILTEELAVLYSILNVVINVFIISALSNTYEHIMDNLPQTDEPLYEKNQDKIYNLSINDYDLIKLDSDHEVTFQSLKSELISQYEELGYVNTVIDKIDSWVVKQEDDGDSYVALRETADMYQIQTFNVDEPVLEILSRN